MATAGRSRALADRLQQRFWESRRPVLGGQLQRLLTLDEIADDTLVRRHPEAWFHLATSGSQVSLELADRSVRMPVHVRPALAHLLDGDGMRVAELKRRLDEEGRRVLVLRLIREGVIERADRG